MSKWAADYTGGAFNNAAENVGLFTFNGNNALSNSNSNYGFRLASDPGQQVQRLRPFIQCHSFGSAVPTMLSNINRVARPVA